MVGTSPRIERRHTRLRERRQYPHGVPTPRNHATVGGIVVGYGATSLAPEVVTTLDRLGDAVVVVNPRGDEASVAPPVVRHVTMTTNAGYAAAVNRGALELAPEIDTLLILTRDADLDPDALDHLVDTLERVPECAIVGPLSSVGDRFRCGGRYPHPGRATHIVADHPSDLDALVDVDWIDGSVMLVRRAVFDRVGGLDAGTFMYVDEVALCLAITDAGHRVLVDTRARASQIPGAPQRSRAHAYLVARNHVRLARRRSGVGAAAIATASAGASTLRSIWRWASGADPGRSHHARSALGFVDGAVAGLLGQSGPPPARVTRGSDVVVRRKGGDG